MITVHKSTGDKAFNLINNFILIIFGILVVYPFWHLLVLSFSTAAYSNMPGLKLFPPQVTLESYLHVFRDDTILNAYIVTITRTVLGVVISVIFSVAAAYALSKEAMPFRNTIYWLFIFSLFFSGGLIPTYILFRSLHLTNTIWALVLPELISAFSILVIKGYMVSIPDSLEESALMDGANEFRMLFSIIIPLCMPIIATVALWNAVYHWNDWFTAMFFVTEPKLAVLQVVLRRVLVEDNVGTLMSISTKLSRRKLYTPESIKAATTIASIGPIIFIYPYAQKFFISGIYSGSVKG